MISSSVLFKPRASVLVPYLAPFVVAYGFIVCTPIIGAIIYSFGADYALSFSFVGLSNYVNMVSDHTFWLAMKNNLILLGFTFAFQITIAFVLSMVLYNAKVRAGGFIQASIFFPVVLSSVVVGFIWLAIYDVNYGL